LTALITSASILFIAIAAFALDRVVFLHKPQNLYYESANGLGPPTLISAAIFGKQQVTSPHVLRTIGGIVFQATAVLNDPLAGKKMTLVYEPTRSDGERVTLKINDANVKVSLFDWELLPILHFVASGDTALVTLLDDPKTDAERNFRDRLFDDDIGVFFVGIHPSLSNTLLGMNAVFVDAMFLGPPDNAESLTARANSYGAQLRLQDPRNPSTLIPIPGYNSFSAPEAQTGTQTMPLGSASKSAARTIVEALNRHHAEGYIVSDFDSNFAATVKNNSLLIDGSPHYYFWHFSHQALSLCIR
jgi:hypothetical protein